MCKILGGELASIKSQGVHNWIVANLLKAKKDTWFGCNDKKKEGSFVSPDETTCDRDASFQNWFRGEPNDYRIGSAYKQGEDCGSIRFTEHRYGKWDDQPCAFEFGFPVSNMQVSKTMLPPLEIQQTARPSTKIIQISKDH